MIVIKIMKKIMIKNISILQPSKKNLFQISYLQIDNDMIILIEWRLNVDNRINASCDQKEMHRSVGKSVAGLHLLLSDPGPLSPSASSSLPPKFIFDGN